MLNAAPHWSNRNVDQLQTFEPNPLSVFLFPASMSMGLSQFSGKKIPGVVKVEFTTTALCLDFTMADIYSPLNTIRFQECKQAARQQFIKA